MQTVAVSSSNVSGAGDALQAQIAALRESLKNHRNRAKKMWDACGAEVEEVAAQSRTALGKFTEKLLKGQMDEAYS